MVNVIRFVIAVAAAVVVIAGPASLAADTKASAKRPVAAAPKVAPAKAQPKTAGAKKAAPKAAAPKTAARKSGTVAKAPARSATGTASRSKTTARARTTRAAAKRAPVRRGQMAPSPDRYKEIQQALADKGYYQGAVSGAWGPESADALKRFQKDQNLTDTGKLDSLSLIALGLGPKRNLSSRSTTESRPKDDNRRPEGSERP